MQRFEGAPQQLHVRFSHWKVDPPEHSVNIQVVSYLNMLSIFFLQKICLFSTNHFSLASFHTSPTGSQENTLKISLEKKHLEKILGKHLDL